MAILAHESHDNRSADPRKIGGGKNRNTKFQLSWKKFQPPSKTANTPLKLEGQGFGVAHLGGESSNSLFEELERWEAQLKQLDQSDRILREAAND